MPRCTYPFTVLWLCLTLFFHSSFENISVSDVHNVTTWYSRPCFIMEKFKHTVKLKEPRLEYLYPRHHILTFTFDYFLKEIFKDLCIPASNSSSHEVTSLRVITNMY